MFNFKYFKLVYDINKLAKHINLITHYTKGILKKN